MDDIRTYGYVVPVLVMLRVRKGHCAEHSPDHLKKFAESTVERTGIGGTMKGNTTEGTSVIVPDGAFQVYDSC